MQREGEREREEREIEERESDQRRERGERGGREGGDRERNRWREIGRGSERLGEAEGERDEVSLSDIEQPQLDSRDGWVGEQTVGNGGCAPSKATSAAPPPLPLSCHAHALHAVTPTTSSPLDRWWPSEWE